MSEFLPADDISDSKKHWRLIPKSDRNRSDRISIPLVTLAGGNCTCSVYLFIDGFF